MELLETLRSRYSVSIENLRVVRNVLFPLRNFKQDDITSPHRNKLTHNLPVSLLSCSPKAITGRAEAKKIYVVGAKILSEKISTRNDLACKE